MINSVLPAPLRFEAAAGEFRVRSGTAVVHLPELAPVVHRFCADVSRRTGLRLLPRDDAATVDEPAVKVELGGGELDALPPATGLSPTGVEVDERHSVAIDREQVVVRGAAPAGVARGLTTLLQLLATSADPDGDELLLPAGRILDGPRYAWRGLSLDVVRRFCPVADVRRVVDVLALYKLNVLHLHLTDDQGWRIPWGRPSDGPGAASRSGGEFYSADDLRALVDYAADRFVTVVPEIDTPGHAWEIVRLHPELDTGRNRVDVEHLPGQVHRTAWLDPDLPATFGVMREVLAGVAQAFPSPYLHIGGDEPYGMPHDRYAAYVRRVRDLVRSVGRRPVGWQESARAGIGADDVLQYWFSDTELPPSLPPEVRARWAADVALSEADLAAAGAASAPVIVSPLSHCYLDVPYAEPSADPEQAQRQSRVGLRVYAPRTVADAFDWDPAEAAGPAGNVGIAGVEAAVWAETVTGLDDLSFLLLPRLPGIATRAWSDPRVADWTDHRRRLARHGRLWEQDGLTYFRSSAVDWP